MILTVLIGNTNTRLVWWDKARPRRRRVVPTATLQHLLKNDRRDSHPQHLLPVSENISGIAIASVVPAITRDVYKYFSPSTSTLLVTARTPAPLKILYNRRLLGADRLCAAVGGYLRYARNLIIVDFGTAITFNIVQQEGMFLGGPILPGVQLMLAALTEHTAQLPQVRFSPHNNPLVHTTTTAIRSGVFHLITGGLERIVNLISRETKRQYFVVATGGGVPSLRHHLRWINKIDPDIASFGLAQLFYLNRRKK